MSTPNLKFLDKYQQDIATLLHANCDKHRLYEVFRDFCELSALSISNAVDRLQFEKREARYLEIVGRYTKEEVERFPKMLGGIALSLEAEFKDCLGQLFSALELGDHWKGQFFTPYDVARTMAEMVMGDIDLAWLQAHGGFFTLGEPAVGAGGMVIAAAHTLHARQLNYQQCMHVTAQDIDSTAVHMTYIQLSLLHVPALVIHGDTLADNQWEYWATPAHIVGLWDERLRRGRTPVAAQNWVLTPAETPTTTDGAPPRSGKAPDIDSARTAITKERLDRAEQMKLF